MKRFHTWLFLLALAVVLILAQSLAAASVSGTIKSFNDTSLVLTHDNSESTFTLNAETRVEGTLKEGAQATVEFQSKEGQNVATRVVVQSANH
ncbi:MAG: hypothetical protein L0212_09040 [Acidobacteria bacterium]|nr:hypothetical protein [Acidobacteriota bacterium]